MKALRRIASVLVVLVLFGCGTAANSTQPARPTPTSNVIPTVTPSPTPSPTPLPPTATPEATPSPVETEPAPPIGVTDSPAPQTVRLRWQSSIWPVFDEAGVKGSRQGIGFEIRIDELIPDSDWNWALAPHWRPVEGNASLSVNVRIVESAGLSDACLVARLTVSFGAVDGYYLCLGSDGMVSAYFASVSCPDGWDIEWLLDYVEHDSIRPVEEINTLKMVTSDHHLWFYVNDALIGEAEHDGPLEGGSAIWVETYDDAPAEIVFHKMTIHDIETTGATTTAAVVDEPGRPTCGG